MQISFQIVCILKSMDETRRRKLRTKTIFSGYFAFLLTLTCSQAVLGECKYTHTLRTVRSDINL